MPFEDLLEAYGNGPPAVYLHSSDKVARWSLEAAEGHSLLGFHDDIISAYRQPQRSFSLYHCVTSFACHRCSDDRDRIYGLLGLVPQDQRLAVDYSKTPEQVFLDVMMALMTRGEWNFSAHYISHSHQASRLREYMGLDNHKEAIRALLKHLSDLGRSDKREEYGVGPGSERLCPSIVLKFTPGHYNTSDTWWCQYRGEIYYGPMRVLGRFCNKCAAHPTLRHDCRYLDQLWKEARPVGQLLAVSDVNHYGRLI